MIDNNSYAQLLGRWRFSPTEGPIVVAVTDALQKLYDSEINFPIEWLSKEAIRHYPDSEFAKRLSWQTG